MQLPEELQQAIEKESAKCKWQDLKNASEQLSQRYRSQETNQPKEFMASKIDHMAYIAARMPATYAAVSRVLNEIKLRLPNLEIHSLLDLGAGPGTAMWAAHSIFPNLNSISLVEQDSALISVGKQLASHSSHQALSQAHWIQANMQKLDSLSAVQPHDLVMMSYSLGELNSSQSEAVLDTAWKLASELIVIVEPGTTYGFEHILKARAQLIKQGASMIAPCPHSMTCPLSSGDWCHFLNVWNAHQSIEDLKMLRWAMKMKNSLMWLLENNILISPFREFCAILKNIRGI